MIKGRKRLRFILNQADYYERWGQVASSLQSIQKSSEEMIEMDDDY